ncbi:MAG TPA: hypothetical protein VHB21_18460 [Minicystis sp.]|nr:hypothetical protein [Minicystis sp.]
MQPIGAAYDPIKNSRRDLVVLVTGFGDFGGVTNNPAGAVAKKVDGSRVDVTQPWGTVHARIVGVGDVPVNFQDDSPEHQNNKDADIEEYIQTIKKHDREAITRIPGPQFVAAEIEMNHPDVVISLGCDAGEQQIRVEREAHNIIRMDAAANDGYYKHAAGAVPYTTKDGAKGYLHDGDTFQTLRARLPVSDIVVAISRAGIPAHDGSDPGSYVCENVMWEVLHEIDNPRAGCHILRGGFIHLPLANPARTVAKMANCIVEAVRATLKDIKPEEWPAGDPSALRVGGYKAY